MIDINILVLLIALACLVSLLSKWLKIPYTIALVLMGLVVSSLQGHLKIHLTEALLLSIFLPALLFEAAWNLHLEYLKDHWLIILVLSVAGLLLSIAAVGGVLTWGLQIPILVSLLFGAMISATDPVSVLALFRQLNLSARLSTIVEAESLFNDGTAVVAFQLILALVLTVGSSSQNGFQLMLNGMIQFLIVSLGGLLIGSSFGFFFAWLISKFNDHLLELMFTVLVAYGSFLTADHISLPNTGEAIHLSGVLATVSAGLVMGVMCRKRGMTESTMTVIDSFWEFAAFFVNSILFLLIGLTIHMQFLLTNWQPILAAIATVLLARAISVFALVPLLNHLSEKRSIPWQWQSVLVWGGLRGALSMALALSLPKTFPERSLFIAMVFGVVLFSLLVQGLTIAPLLRVLKLSNPLEEN
jgi:CPA1 family monovalent cation:H+ antiporter